MTEAELRRSYPEIKWDEPLPVTVPGVGRGLACRICIALQGLTGRDVPSLPQDARGFAEHLASAHGSGPTPPEPGASSAPTP